MHYARFGGYVDPALVEGLPELSTSTVPARKPPPPGVRRVFEEFASGAVNATGVPVAEYFSSGIPERHVLEVDVPGFFVHGDPVHTPFARRYSER